MKILRKRVGSFFINGSEEDYIIKEDSILKDNEIVFNYLPIKKLLFFNLNFKKSSIEKKCWVYLDLNLNKLYEFLAEGKILMNRQIMFEMIHSSYNKRKKFEFSNLFQEIIKKKINLENLKKIDFDKKIKIFDKDFIKFNKIFFNLEKKIITINKCKLKSVKLPNYFILNNFYEIGIYDSILNLINSEKENNNLIIISKKYEEVLNKLFIKNNGSNYIKFKNIIHSEDLNYQMNNYYKNVISQNNSNLEKFINQIDFESKNFFYKRKNIFILCKNLSEYSYSYLTNCEFENIFIIDSSNIEKFICILTKKYNSFRTDYKQDNLITTEYLLLNNIYRLDIDDKIEKVDSYIYEFPFQDWKSKSDIHLLDMCKKNKLISNFIKIGKKYEWNNESINILESLASQSNSNTLSVEDLEENPNCPISLSKLNSFSIKTPCNHKFNLKPILDWISEGKNDCPICRENINLNKLEFNFIPNFHRFIEQIKNNKNWIIVIDKQWNDFLKNYFNNINFEGKIIKFYDLSKKYINQIYNLTVSSDILFLNLTLINNLDIKFLLGISNNYNIKFLSLYEKN
tara:strand:- start:907 stop:2616 length:1710 start_codon:yes stop_codon:yes gene_type:complete